MKQSCIHPPFVYLAAVVVFVAWIWSLIPAAPVHNYAIRLHFDGGGSIGDHMKFFTYIAASGAPVKVDGDCVSACTLVLTLAPSQVCIFPYARLGFHLATIGGLPDPEITQEMIDRFYPTKVQEWIIVHGPLKEAPIYLKGDEAIRLGILSAC